MMRYAQGPRGESSFPAYVAAPPRLTSNNLQAEGRVRDSLSASVRSCPPNVARTVSTSSLRAGDSRCSAYPAKVIQGVPVYRPSIGKDPNAMQPSRDTYRPEAAKGPAEYAHAGVEVRVLDGTRGRSPTGMNNVLTPSTRTSLNSLSSIQGDPLVRSMASIARAAVRDQDLKQPVESAEVHKMDLQDRIVRRSVLNYSPPPVIRGGLPSREVSSRTTIYQPSREVSRRTSLKSDPMRLPSGRTKYNQELNPCSRESPRVSPRGSPRKGSADEYLQVLTTDALEKRMRSSSMNSSTRSGSQNTSTDDQISDEDFVKSLLNQSDQFSHLLRSHGLEAYMEQWSELIEETCVDFTKPDSISPRGRSQSELTLQTIDENKHDFHNPTLAKMAHLAAAAKRRLQLTQPVQAALVNLNAQETQASDSECSQEAVKERYRRFKTRITKFLQEVGAELQKVKEEQLRKSRERQASPDQAAPEDTRTARRAASEESKRTGDLGTLSLRAFIGELRSMEVTQKMLDNEEPQAGAFSCAAAAPSSPRESAMLTPSTPLGPPRNRGPAESAEKSSHGDILRTYLRSTSAESKLPETIGPTPSAMAGG